MTRVLVLLDWFLPAFRAGGQIPSVANLVRALEGPGLSFWILASDRDFGQAEPLEGIEPGRWTTHQGFRVFYLPQGRLSRERFRLAVAEASPQVIYLNSFFSKEFTIKPLLFLRKMGFAGRVVLAPRGMLGQGALALKAGKKRIFLAAAKLLGLYRGLLWHASSELERQEILRQFPRASVLVAIDLAELPAPPAPGKALHHPPRFFFFSRISRKKNLKYALERMLEARLEAGELHLVGPVEEPDYWQECLPLLERLRGAGVAVRAHGGLPPEQARALLGELDIMLLPTLNENFGHVIAEALAAGCPVLLSDQTPWAELEARGAGWLLPLDQPARWAARLRACALLGAEGYRALSAAARAEAERVLRDPRSLDDNRRLFEPGP